MILHRTIPAKRLLALLASVCMATAMGACSPNGDSQSQQQPSSQSSATADAGNVAIFAPTDSITISQQTPLSKWEKLVPEIVETDRCQKRRHHRENRFEPRQTKSKRPRLCGESHQRDRAFVHESQNHLGGGACRRDAGIRQAIRRLCTA